MEDCKTCIYVDRSTSEVPCNDCYDYTEYLPSNYNITSEYVNQLEFDLSEQQKEIKKLQDYRVGFTQHIKALVEMYPRLIHDYNDLKTRIKKLEKENKK